MTEKIKIISILVYAFLLFGFISQAKADSPDDIVIIVNKSLNVDEISIDDLRRLFLRQKTFIGNQSVTPVNARSGSDIRKAFVQKALSMTEAQEAAFWEDQKIRTGSQKPAELANTIKAIFSIKNGISYCYRKDFNPDVAKIILVLK